MLFGSRKKEIKYVFLMPQDMPPPLPPCSIGLTGWSGLAEQACLCSTLMPLQWAENIQSMPPVA